MTAASWLVLIGGVMQVAGVIVTFIGATQTWNEFSPDEQLFANEIQRAQSFVHSIYLRLRKLIGRPIPARMSSMKARAALKFDARSNPTSGYSAIDTTGDIPGVLQELDRRTRELRDETNRVTSQLFKELPQLRRRLDVIEKELAESIARLEHRDRQVATGGIKAVLAGLILVGLGVIVQSASIFV